jgi:hypothetical protein
VAYYRLLPSLTVAGQWRIFTALPVHLTMSSQRAFPSN